MKDFPFWMITLLLLRSISWEDWEWRKIGWQEKWRSCFSIFKLLTWLPPSIVEPSLSYSPNQSNFSLLLLPYNAASPSLSLSLLPLFQDATSRFEHSKILRPAPTAWKHKNQTLQTRLRWVARASGLVTRSIQPENSSSRNLVRGRASWWSLRCWLPFLGSAFARAASWLWNCAGRFMFLLSCLLVSLIHKQTVRVSGLLICSSRSHSKWMLVMVAAGNSDFGLMSHSVH